MRKKGRLGNKKIRSLPFLFCIHISTTAIKVGVAYAVVVAAGVVDAYEVVACADTYDVAACAYISLVVAAYVRDAAVAVVSVYIPLVLVAVGVEVYDHTYAVEVVAEGEPNLVRWR